MLQNLKVKRKISTCLLISIIQGKKYLPDQIVVFDIPEHHIGAVVLKETVNTFGA